MPSVLNEGGAKNIVNALMQRRSRLGMNITGGFGGSFYARQNLAKLALVCRASLGTHGNLLTRFDAVSEAGSVLHNDLMIGSSHFPYSSGRSILFILWHFVIFL